MHLSSSICPDSLKQKCPLLPVCKKGYQAKGTASLIGYQQYLLLGFAQLVRIKYVSLLLFCFVAFFPSLPHYLVFSTGLSPAVLGGPRKGWQTGQRPPRQQHVFRLRQRESTVIPAARISQHWPITVAAGLHASVCRGVCVGGRVFFACSQGVKGDKDTYRRM